MNNIHNSVLLRESIDSLVIDPNGIYIDGTFGRGGDSLEILKDNIIIFMLYFYITKLKLEQRCHHYHLGNQVVQVSLASPKKYFKC